MSDAAINWADFKEAPTVGTGENECKGCAFRDGLLSCEQAFATAPTVFGGDCMTNNVIYIRTESTK